jgi:hypothetical protein
MHGVSRVFAPREDGCWLVTHPCIGRERLLLARTEKPRRGCRLWLAPEEGQQVGVELVLMGRGEAMRRARIVDLLRALDEPGRFPGRVIDGNDLVVLAVQDQGV